MELRIWTWIHLFSHQLFLESYYVPGTVLEWYCNEEQRGKIPAHMGLPFEQGVDDIAKSKQ